MRRQGVSLTDHSRLATMDDADIERAVASDPDFEGVSTDWHRSAVAVVPAAKTLVSLRLDRDVIDAFRAFGPDYQARINAVLRAHLDHAGADGNKGKSAS